MELMSCMFELSWQWTFLRVVIIFFCIIVSVYYLCAVASKHQWNPKNIRANDNCSVRDSKDVCW